MIVSMMHGSMVALWWLIAITLMVGVVAAVVALSHGTGRRSGLDALGERYAAGEIDDDEYRRRRRLLEER